MRAAENFKRITLPFNPSLMKEILNKKITDMLLPKTKTIVEKNTIQMGSAFPPIGWGGDSNGKGLVCDSKQNFEISQIHKMCV